MRPHSNPMISFWCRIACLLATVYAAGICHAGSKWEQSVLNVNVTQQSFDFVRPWQKTPPVRQTSIGVVIPGPRVLVPATLLANATLVELERIGTGNDARATVLCVDYISNLAVLTIDDPEFAAELRPVKINARTRVDDKLTACQFEKNGTEYLSEGRIKNIETAVYPTGIGEFLVGRVSVDFALGNTGNVPFFHKSRLAGIMTAYNAANRTASLIPGAVIQHFLTDLEDGTYEGFPRAGFAFGTIKDPQLRNYVGLAEHEQGIYITSVQPGGPADKAGIAVDDVLLAINGFNIDKHAEYPDPDYGALRISHLLATRSFAGDIVEVTVLRDGERIKIELVLEARSTREYPIEPFIIDRAPEYFIIGGLVFQELSGELLRVWGGDWRNKAPRRLTRFERHQWSMLEPGEKLVVLVQALPSPGNMGYENIGMADVATINGKTIHRLEDVRDALAAPEGDFHRVGLGGAALPDILLKVADTFAEDAQIQRAYRLPSLSYIEPASP